MEEAETGGGGNVKTIATLSILAGLFPAATVEAQNVLTAKGSGTVIVWASEAAAQSGTRLIQAGQSDLAVKYAACVVPTGTKVVIMPTGGYSTHRVTVIDGPRRGCEGNVYSSNILSGRGGKTLADEQRERMSRYEAESKAITDCGKLTTDAIQAGKGIEALKLNDECMTKRGFPPMKFDSDAKPIKTDPK
jgi:hypothetical protein